MSDALKDIVFIASAGTGKTHQVTELYKALILEGECYPDANADDQFDRFAEGEIVSKETAITCDDIIMLTFANAAASEMRTRITRKVEELLGEATADEAAPLWGILRDLSGATISTIHSFAQRVIKENSILAGISPRMRILEESGEPVPIYDEEAGKIVLDILEKPEHPAYSLIRELCQTARAGGVVQALSNFNSACINRGIDLARSECEDRVAVPDVPTYAELSALRAQYAEPLEASPKNQRPGKFRVAFDEWLEDNPNPTEEQVILACTDWLNALAVTSDWSKDGKEPERNELRDALREVIARGPGHGAGLALQQFVGVAQEVASAYAHRKHVSGYMDFNDLLQCFYRLLVEHGKEIAPKAGVIVVDEAQDNSHLQNMIISRLRELTGAKVVLCGDRKQVIHTWRGAAADGMHRYKLTLGEAVEISLAKSYRSEGDLIEWINSVSIHILEKNFNEEEALIPRQQGAGCRGQADSEPGACGTPVELLCPDLLLDDAGQLKGIASDDPDEHAWTWSKNTIWEMDPDLYDHRHSPRSSGSGPSHQTAG